MSGGPTQEYYDWVAAGRNWTLCRPITELYTWIGAQGITRLGTIGSDNAAHLQAAIPQDHTPFSYTAWPWPLPGYVVTACDAANESRNGISLGDGCLSEARAGRMPWLKYINFDNKQYHCRDGFQAVKYNGDQHCHFSARTDQLGTGLNPDFNPFKTGTDDMTPDQEAIFNSMAGRMLAISANTPTVEWAGAGTTTGERNELHFVLKHITEMLEAGQPVNLSPAQLAALGTGISAGVLKPLASAAEAEAHVLRNAAGS